MTISSTTNRNDYIGTEITGPYSYTFPIFAATDLQITKTVSGTTTTLTYLTDYTVAGVGDAAGGTITLLVALTAGGALTIRRIVPLTQPTSFRNQGGFFPATHEEAFDRLVAIAQQLDADIDSTLRIPATSDPAGFTMTLPGPVAGKALGWNGGGTALVNLDTTGLVNNTVITSASVTSTRFDLENTSAGGRGWAIQSIGSGTAGRIGDFDIGLASGGPRLLALKPDGRVVLAGANSADGVQLEVQTMDPVLLNSSLLGVVLHGQDWDTSSPNSPHGSGTTLFRRAYTLDLNTANVAGLVSQHLMADQVIIQGGLHPATTGDRYIAVDWKDYYLKPGGGANVDAFTSGMMNLCSGSASYTGILVGREFDTTVNAPSAVSNPYMVSVLGVCGPNSGPSSVTNFTAGLQGVGLNNGTGTVAHLIGIRGDAQLSNGTGAPGTTTAISLFYAGDATLGPSAGTLGSTATYSAFRAGRGTFPNANATNMYAFFAEAATAADKFNSRFGDGDWNTGHIQLGTTHLWINGGKLYLKAGVPANGTDGTVVGTQS